MLPISYKRLSVPDFAFGVAIPQFVDESISERSWVSNAPSNHHVLNVDVRFDLATFCIHLLFDC